MAWAVVNTRCADIAFVEEESQAVPLSPLAWSVEVWVGADGVHELWIDCLGVSSALVVEEDAGGEHGFVVFCVEVHAQTDLSHSGGADDLACCFADLGDAWEHDGDEEAYDGDGDQDIHECEGTRSTRPAGS